MRSPRRRLVGLVAAGSVAFLALGGFATTGWVAAAPKSLAPPVVRSADLFDVSRPLSELPPGIH